MKNKTLLISILLILIAGGAYWLYAHQTPQTNTEKTESTLSAEEKALQTMGAMETGELPSTGVDAEANTSAIKEFTISNDHFSYTPNNITVKKGDNVKITFNNTGGTHDLKIDEFAVATPILGANKSATVEFKATKTGSFQYYCSVGNHRAMGMWGTLTVTE